MAFVFFMTCFVFGQTRVRCRLVCHSVSFSDCLFNLVDCVSRHVSLKLKIMKRQPYKVFVVNFLNRINGLRLMFYPLSNNTIFVCV